jgi:hypothetical protein
MDIIPFVLSAFRDSLNYIQRWDPQFCSTSVALVPAMMFCLHFCLHACMTQSVTWLQENVRAGPLEICS